VDLESFWIDRHEVTNRQFKAFVDAGGYKHREHWTQPFVKDGVELTWEQAMTLFRDPTGRPGPATWDLGEYPDGQGDHPVGGVSWYEAAAYCTSIGKRLPTGYHWARATHPDSAGVEARHGNFGSSGPQPVGGAHRIGRFGTYDQAGNVREWVWNERSDNRRFALGGGWNEPNYMFPGLDAHPPFDRSPMSGIRCARYAKEPPPAAMARFDVRVHDHRLDRPVDDREFAVYKSLYHYRTGPLDPTAERLDDGSPHWRVERVSVAAAYGGERVPALLFVPRSGSPPYQTVFWLPDIQAYRPGSKLGDGESARRWFSFLLRGGRAVVLAAVKGSYERQPGGGGPSYPRDQMIQAVQDIGRMIDYLETRSDEFDTGKLAYVGMSFGGTNGPIMTTMEPRFTVSVLLSAGLQRAAGRPEVDPLNFLSRVTVPTLMINGKHDGLFRYEVCQKPMFDLLGTPQIHKRHDRLEGSHLPTDRQKMHKAALEWLDKYLGPVRTP
jgi:hypothetical protein